MDKKSENRLTMYEGIITLLQENTAKAQSIKGYADSLKDLTSVVDNIKQKFTETETVAAGKTAVKDDAESSLIDAMVAVSSGLQVYARKQNDPELKDKTAVREWELHRMRDTQLAETGKTIADLAKTNAAGIAPFGITAQMVTDLKAKADAYSSAIGDKESSLAQRKGARESMNTLFNQADEILNEEFDRYAEVLRLTDTDFYNKYIAARVVKDTGVRHPGNGQKTVEAAAATTK